MSEEKEMDGLTEIWERESERKEIEPASLLRWSHRSFTPQWDMGVMQGSNRTALLVYVGQSITLAERARERERES